MGKLRTVTWLGAVIAALTLVSACGSSSSNGTTEAAPGSTAPATTATPTTTPTTTAAEPVGVAVFLSISANSWEQAQLAGATAATKELGGGEVQAFDGNFDSNKQIAQIQDATTSGKFKVFVIEPIDTVAVVPSLQKAAAAGIKVVCILTPCGADMATVTNQFEGQAGTVATDFPGTAKAMADRAIEACVGIDPCKVAYLNGDTTFTSDRILMDTVKATLKAAAGVDLVSAQDGKYDTGTARGVFQNMLQRNPDINVLISWSDQMTLGAEQAAKTAGVIGKLKIISNGASEQAVKAVIEGRWLAETVGQPFTLAKVAAEIGIKLARGETVDQTEVKVDTLSPVGEFVTKENAAQFTPEWAG